MSNLRCALTGNYPFALHCEPDLHPDPVAACSRTGEPLDPASDHPLEVGPSDGSQIRWSDVTSWRTLSDSLLACAGPMSGATLALLAPSGSLVAVVGAFKAGFEVGRCLAEEQQQRAEQRADERARAECEGLGGEPGPIADGVLACYVDP